MAKRVLLPVLVLLLSGCSGSESRDADDTAEENLPDPFGDVVPSEMQRFDATYDLVAIDVSVLGSNYAASQDSDNCLIFDDKAHLTNLTATVTWADDPTKPRMELVLAQGGLRLVTGAGKGEASVAIDELIIGGGPDALLSWQVASSEPAGAMFQVSGTLHLVADYVVPDDRYGWQPDEGWTCVA